tara:strand:+ start:190 stop:501 length:312 start_codon:yes stop_codon:yes gene_type:complete
MSHTIKVNVTEAVRDFYPGLSHEQTQYFSELIHARFDYSQIYDYINDQIGEIAYVEGIELTGKDGVSEDTNELLGTADGQFYYKKAKKVVPLFDEHTHDSEGC